MGKVLKYIGERYGWRNAGMFIEFHRVGKARVLQGVSVSLAGLSAPADAPSAQSKSRQPAANYNTQSETSANTAYCVGCQYVDAAVQPVVGGDVLVCRHPQAQPSVVTGLATCDAARAITGPCGPEAKLRKPLEQ